MIGVAVGSSSLRGESDWVVVSERDEESAESTTTAVSADVSTTAAPSVLFCTACVFCVKFVWLLCVESNSLSRGTNGVGRD